MSKRFKHMLSGVSLERIKVQNFKSFQSLDISLDKLNVVIGANASGKSNLAQVFKFLSDIVTDGLDSAISRQGGMEYLLNFTSPKSNLSYEITLNVPAHYTFIHSVVEPNDSVVKVVYRFEIQPENNSEFKIIDDTWKFSVDMSDDRKKLPPFEIIIKNKGAKIEIDISDPKHSQPEDELKLIRSIGKLFSKLHKPQLLSLENSVMGIYTHMISSFFQEIEVYDLDPKTAKLATQMSGSDDLEPDGRNLAAVMMKNVMGREDRQKTFSNIIVDALPFVNKVETKKQMDSSVMLVQKENCKDKMIPSNLFSDGTINVTALIYILYFQHNPLTIIEEPEKSIHPSLMDRVVNMMKDASNKKQIIATTHSTEMIRYVGIEDVLLVRRSEKGNSEIVKPGNQADVQQFLENDMDVRELFAQNMLGE